MTTRFEAVRSADGWGVRLVADGWQLAQDRPVAVLVPGGPATGTAVAYAQWTADGGGGRGCARVPLGDDAWADVTDTWSLVGDDVRVARELVVCGTSRGAFGSRLSLRRDDVRAGWADVAVFVPGVAYGDATQVAEGALGGLPARHAGVRAVLVREDRAAAPLFVARYPDGGFVALLHEDVRGGTTAADCLVPDGGEVLVDERFDFASLGGVVTTDETVELGLWFPATEGEYTYSSGGLPLGQPRAWRARFQPVRDGLRQRYTMVVRTGSSAAGSGVAALAGLASTTWRWAWDELRPAVPPVDVGLVADAVLDVLTERVVTVADRTGVALEADAVERDDHGCATVSVMGFVGAATDAGYLLLRAGGHRPGDRGMTMARQGAAILDTFAAMPMDPPAGEGFDTVTGGWATYRSVAGRPAVYARSVAEGCLATLRAEAHEADAGRSRPVWRTWWQAGARWLVANQDPDGGLPRAWEAGTGEVLDPSRSSAAVVVPFLVAAARCADEPRWLEAAVAAGSHAWAEADRTGCFAGGTLDNPDVVDKEAAVLALEAFCDLHQAVGGQEWLERALVAARLAETWTYIWDVPMPVDADPADLHWKSGVPTVGHQLITTGASMTDGFLAVNAAAFARLWRLTGDDHWLEVARLVTHGTTSMLALPGRTFDLRGVGWQQEHWCFGGRRGYGLNRRWLTWVPVAHALGAARLEDLGPWAAAVTGGGAQ